MANNLEGHSGEESTDINELLRNLSDIIIKLKDARIKYLAAAAIRQLASLRAAAANSGFVHWNLLNKVPLTGGGDSTFAYRNLLEILDKLTDALRVFSRRHSLDAQGARALSRILEAWEALKEHQPH